MVDEDMRSQDSKRSNNVSNGSRRFYDGEVSKPKVISYPEFQYNSDVQLVESADLIYAGSKVSQNNRDFLN